MSYCRLGLVCAGIKMLTVGVFLLSTETVNTHCRIEKPSELFISKIFLVHQVMHGLTEPTNQPNTHCISDSTDCISDLLPVLTTVT